MRSFSDALLVCRLTNRERDVFLAIVARLSTPQTLTTIFGHSPLWSAAQKWMWVDFLGRIGCLPSCSNHSLVLSGAPFLIALAACHVDGAFNVRQMLIVSATSGQ